MSDETIKRLDRQGRQQELIIDIMRRALQRLAEAEADLARLQSQLIQHADQFERQADRMDAFGDALEQMRALRCRLQGQQGELERAVTGGRDDRSS